MINLNVRPMLITYEITHLCNHSCSYCFNTNREQIINSSRNLFDKRTFFKVIHWAIESGFYEINFTGGEPLLPQHKPIIYDGLKICAENLINSSFSTNLIYLTNQDIDVFKDKINDLFVSFPHHQKSKYNEITKSEDYDLFIKNLELAINNSLPIKINMVVLPDTINDIVSNARFLKKNFGLSFFGIGPIGVTASYLNHLKFDSGQINDLITQLIILTEENDFDIALTHPFPPCIFPNIEIINDYPSLFNMCPAGTRLIAVTPDGTIKACKCYSQNYGSVFNTTFEDSFELMKIWWENNPGIIPDQCKSCDLKLICRGGCRAESWNFSGKLNSKPIYEINPITHQEKFRDKYTTIISAGKLNPNTTVTEINTNYLKIKTDQKEFILKGDDSKLFSLLMNEVFVNNINIDTFIKKHGLRHDLVFNFVQVLYNNGIFEY